MFTRDFRNIWLLVPLIVACQQVPQPTASSALKLQAGTGYYVNCAAASNGSGSSSSPWNTLATVNATTFVAADAIYFNRGTTCNGMLSPKGSGSSSGLIKVGAYGSGAKPIIAGGTNQAAIKLYNQHHWRVENLETTGGNPFGVYVAGNQAGTLDQIQLVGLTVRDVAGIATQKESGLVVVTPESKDTAFSNVLIDGIIAYNTQQWSGILVGSDNYESLGFTGSVASTNITIQNSMVYNTNGDGIVLFHVNNGLIQNSVAHDVGKMPNGSVGTPNGIWTWWCNTCTVQFNEAYNVASPGVDGGAFDIDYWNDNNIVQYNYGHDNQGYCIALFGAGSRATTNSIVRYNVCANNGRTVSGSQQGDMKFSTWGGGSIDGIQVYNNTFYWNPVANEPVVVNKNVALNGTNPRFFRNNIVVSTVDKLIWSDNNLSFNNNLYWFTGTTNPYWGYNNGWWTSLSAFQSATAQDTQSVYGNPLLSNLGYHAVGSLTTQYNLQSNSPAINAATDVGNMGARDYFGNSTPKNGAYDLGAYESNFANAISGNSILNPSFENGSTDWNNWWDTAANPASAAYFSNQGGYTGSYRLTHWSASSAYKQYTSQTQNALPAGTYTLSAWVQTSGGLTKISFGAKNCNGSGIQEYSVPTAGNGMWVQYSTQIVVSSSTCEVFAWSESLGGTERWANFDDLQLIKN